MKGAIVYRVWFGAGLMVLSAPLVCTDPSPGGLASFAAQCTDGAMPTDTARGGEPASGSVGWAARDPILPPAAPPPPNDTPKNRFLSIDPTTNDVPVAYQVELTESAYFGASVGSKWWVTDPVCTDTDGNAVPPPCTGENIWRSQLVATAPAPRMWTEEVVHIGDREVVPVATYQIVAYDGASFSAPLEISTIAKPGEKYWADCVGEWNGTQWTVPNQVVNMDDVMAAVFYFTSAANKPHRTWVEVDDEGVNMVLNFTDIMRIVQGFKSEEYPFTLPIPGMVLIPGGEFEMGDHHGDGNSDELPIHPVYIDSFYMDIYEVTNQQYCDYLNSVYAQGLIEVNGEFVYSTNGSDAYYCSTDEGVAGSRIHWDGAVFTVTADKEDHPMTQVSWYGAVAYANWRSAQHGRDPSYDLFTWECDFDANGYRLPTEAQWEYAARGGVHPECTEVPEPYCRYPWSDTIDGSNANFGGSGDPYEGTWPPDPETTPVGYYDGDQTPAGADMANGYGLYDVAGNLYEWCNDFYDSAYYASSPYDNPRGPLFGTGRVVRGGGSWTDGTLNLRCALRSEANPLYLFCNGGFRLALDFE